MEDILVNLRRITYNMKPPELTTRPAQHPNPQAEQEHLDQLWDWLQQSLSKDRFGLMAGNLEKLEESAVLAKARDLEVLALKLDIDQAHEIGRGRDFNIIKKQ